MAHSVKKNKEDIIVKNIEDEQKIKKIEETTSNAKKDMFLSYAPYLIIIFFVVIIRMFIATPVKVNGSSMNPTLKNNDTMILYKLAKKIKGVKRFDIVVISTDSGKLIKRVIGLPGDKITYKIEVDEKDKDKSYGVLYINDKKVKETFIDEEAKLNTCRDSWEICEKEIVVPNGEYFVMGDNRYNSKDSRMIGTIKEESIMGITKLLIFPLNRFGNVK